MPTLEEIMAQSPPARKKLTLEEITAGGAPQTPGELVSAGSLSPNDPLANVGKNQERAPSAGEFKEAAADIGMGALPALGAMGLTAITAMSGPASPILAPIAMGLAAYIGGAGGKHAETGLRAVTGIGAENLPDTPGSRLIEMHVAGKEQLLMEATGQVAMRSAAKASEITAGLMGASPAALEWAEGTALGKAMAREKAAAKTLAERQAAVEGVDAAKTLKLDAAKLRRDDLVAQKAEESFRIKQIEGAHEGVAEIFRGAGVLDPKAGMTDMTFNQMAASTAKKFEDNLVSNLHGDFGAFESAIRSRGGGKPVDVRPLFKRTVEKIKQEFHLTGTGKQFTELHPSLATLLKDFEQYSKGKAAVLAPPNPTNASLGLIGPRTVLQDAMAAVDKEQGLGGLVAMQSGLTQEIMRLKKTGDTKAAGILEGLLLDTQLVVRRELVGVNKWDDLASVHEGLRKSWGSAKGFMEQQAFKTIRDHPERITELLTAKGGYAPVVKKVLEDTGEYQTMWPEIRRRWLEANLTKGGKFDPALAVQSLKENRPVLGQIFDTPQAKQTLRRIDSALVTLNALQLKALRSVADYKKLESLNKALEEINPEIVRIYEEADKKMFAAVRAEDKAAEAAKAAGQSARQAGSLWGGGSIPSMLMSRGGAGVVMGGAGAALGGHAPNVYGAAAGAAIGAGLMAGRNATIRRIIEMAEREPTTYTRFMRILDDYTVAGGIASAAKATVNERNLPNLLRAVLVGRDVNEKKLKLERGAYRRD